MKAKYIIRLDDASEFMDMSKWKKYFDLFDKYNIKPIIGVIPHNKDPKMINNKIIKDFWQIVKEWEGKEYIIALHGYNHLYKNRNKGIMGINQYSEFAGIDYMTQLEMIRLGIEKFRKESISTNIFIAPAHSFDNNTIKALKANNIEYISDGFFCNPIRQNGINWIPQQLWKPVKKKHGVWTICIHPETLQQDAFLQLDTFVRENFENFVNPYSLIIKDRFSFVDKINNFNVKLMFLLKRRIYNLLLKIKQ